MFCNVLHDEKGKIRDLISDLLARKSESLFTVLIPVFARGKHKQLGATFSNFNLFFFGWIQDLISSGERKKNQAIAHVLSCS